MKYMCLIYDDESMFATTPKKDLDSMMADYGAFTAEVTAAGQLIASERLAFSTSATTIRIRNGKTMTTDGPFAETTEQLGGFYLIEAKDLNEAIQIASRIPSARSGLVEVRPVWEAM